MAKPSIELINALRKTAENLANGAPYARGNHGTCNCGNLIQVTTQLSKEEILTYAHTGWGEWTELAEEFCPTLNTPVNLLLKKLQDLGLTPTDIHNIEYLEDRTVLDHLPGGFRWLQKNKREDVIEYLNTFSNLLEDALCQHINLNELIESSQPKEKEEITV
jgi:hypothetical protein